MKNYQKQEENWKIVRNRVCIRALLIFLGVVLMQVLAYMVCVAGMTVFAFLTGKNGFLRLAGLVNVEEFGRFMVWVSLVSALFSMVWCGILYKKSSWRESTFDYRQAFGMKNVLAIFGTGVGGCIVLTMFLSFLAMVVPQAFSSYNAIMENLTDTSMAVTLIYVLLAGPASEELIFRGAILDRFYLAFPFLLANVLQAALFGVYHMNLIQGIYAFCLGFVLGIIRQVTGSILASILTHILFNSTSFGLDLLFPADREIQIWQMVLLTLAGLSVCAFSLRYLWKEYQTGESIHDAVSGRADSHTEIVKKHKKI